MFKAIIERYNNYTWLEVKASVPGRMSLKTIEILYLSEYTIERHPEADYLDLSIWVKGAYAGSLKMDEIEENDLWGEHGRQTKVYTVQKKKKTTRKRSKK